MSYAALEKARELARAYRAALRVADPEKCAQIDTQARKRGQWWAAPSEIPAEAIDDALDAVLRPIDIENHWGIPSATIRAWAAKGLLQSHGEKGRPRFLVRDVLAVEGRNRKRR